MIFSRDAVQSKLQSLANSPSERAQTMMISVWGNLVLSIALLLSSFFTSSIWGGSLSFQASSTALLLIGVLFTVQEWLKKPDLQRLDVIGGAYIVLMLMLFQTTLIWGKMASGFMNSNNGPIPCYLGGSGGDHAVSILSATLLVTNVIFCSMAYKWRGDWLNGSPNYVNINPTGNADGRVSELGRTKDVQGQAVNSATQFDYDVEGGL
jgi:hypothetical protein